MFFKNRKKDAEAIAIKRLLIGLGWEARITEGVDFDLDLSAFLLTKAGRVLSDRDFIFYNQLSSPCGTAIHSGDSLTGEGQGDDETITLELAKAPEHVTRIVLTVSLHDADLREQTFGRVFGAFIRMLDLDTQAELARIDLTGQYATQTALQVAEVYKEKNGWFFKTLGEGSADGLHGLCKQFGVHVA